MNGSFKAVLLIGMLLIACGLWFAFYQRGGGGLWGHLVGAYVFGLTLMSGIFTAYPGSIKVRNGWGEKIRVSKGLNLSKLQVLCFLGWFIGFGGVLAYISALSKNL